MRESMKQFEVNFDGLVGPTHNYAGLSFGNVASLNNANAISSPKQAAKQGLAKAKVIKKSLFHKIKKLLLFMLKGVAESLIQLRVYLI